MPQYYGDILEYTGSGRAIPISSDLRQIDMSDGSRVYLVLFPDDILADEYRLAALIQLPNGTVTSRLYTVAEINKVAAMKAGDTGLLTAGISIDDLRRPASPVPAPPKGFQDGKVVDNTVQTPREVDVASNPEIMKAVASVFAQPNFQKCPDQWQNTVIKLDYPLRDGRNVPSFAAMYNCFFGNPTVTWIEFPIQESGQVRRHCSTTWKLQSTQQLFLKEIQRSTKIAFHLGLPLSGGSGGTIDVTPKPGEQVNKDGKPEKKQAGSSGGDSVNFDFEFMRTYAKLTIEAYHRLDIQLEEVVCRPPVG